MSTLLTPGPQQVKLEPATREERRNFALLHAAATLYGVIHSTDKVADSAAIARDLLSEIESHEDMS